MNWKVLKRQFDDGNTVEGITLESLPYYDTVMTPLYRVSENIGQFKFEMLRLQLSKRKITIFDDLGLVGVSSLDLNDDFCYLTEGVSDFLSAKLMFKETEHHNVLGCTTLGGNANARKILLGLFNNYCIITDNDTTGIKNIQEFRQWLVQNGKTVQMRLPETGCKDISIEFCKKIGF